MENITEVLKRERVLGDAAREHREMRAEGEWLATSLAAASETCLSIANIDPLTSREKTLLPQTPGGSARARASQ